MRLLWTIGRLVIFDIYLFQIEEEDEVVVIHDHGPEDKPESGEIFGEK